MVNTNRKETTGGKGEIMRKRRNDILKSKAFRAMCALDLDKKIVRRNELSTKLNQFLKDNGLDLKDLKNIRLNPNNLDWECVVRC